MWLSRLTGNGFAGAEGLEGSFSDDKPGLPVIQGALQKKWVRVSRDARTWESARVVENRARKEGRMRIAYLSSSCCQALPGQLVAQL